MMDAITIRKAVQSDDADIAELMDQLGYPSQSSAVGHRLTRLLTVSSEQVLAAEHKGHVIGVVSCHLTPLLHEDGLAGRITSLVVSERHRGHGIGARLVAEAEAWLWSQGCGRIEITSGAHRVGAHGFYDSLGYTCNGKRFMKRRQ